MSIETNACPPLDPYTLYRAVTPPTKLLIMLALDGSSPGKFATPHTIATRLNAMQEEPLAWNFLREGTKGANPIIVHYCEGHFEPVQLVKIEQPGAEKGPKAVYPKEIKLTDKGRYLGAVASGAILPTIQYCEPENARASFSQIIGPLHARIPAGLALYKLLHSSPNGSGTVTKLQHAAELSHRGINNILERLQNLGVLVINGSIGRVKPAERLFRLDHPSVPIRFVEKRGTRMAMVARELARQRDLGITQLTGADLHNILEELCSGTAITVQQARLAFNNLLWRQAKANMQVPLIREITPPGQKTGNPTVTLAEPYLVYTKRLVNIWEQLTGNQPKDAAFRADAAAMAEEIADDKPLVTALFSRFYNQRDPSYPRRSKNRPSAPPQ